MARRISSARQQVSLFPFLDILGCLIGSLILIITTVVLEQMDTQPIAEAARIDDLRRQAAREAMRRKRLEEQLAGLAEQSGPLQQRLASARERAAEAARREAEARQALTAAERLAIDTPKPPPPADTTALVARRKQLDAESAKIRAEIAARTKQPEQSIVILPPGSGGGPKRGVFVEAAKGKAIVHDGKPWEAPAGKVAGDPRFKALLAKIRGDKDAIVTFLIRPDGVGTYAEMQKAADAAGVRFGREPLPGAGKLDLSEAR